MTKPSEQFVSERIEAVAGTWNTTPMATGAPGFPQRFTWRGQEYAVDQILETWKESSPCHHGSSELYLRKHWYRIRTTSGEVMKIYFERQARSKSQAKARWWLYTVEKK